MTLVLSPNRNITNGRQIDLWVVHDMEAPPGPLTAENVANYFTNPAVRASAHYNYDQDSEVQSVPEKDIAWHAPGANHNGVGAEHAGFARYVYEEWVTAEGMSMLRLSAARCADVCRRNNIPIRFVDAEGLLRGERGITTHLEVTRAFRKGTHWDPGYSFPMDLYISLVVEASGGVPSAPPTSEPGVSDEGARNLSVGMSGDDVTDWQKILRGWGAPIGNPPTEEPDGNFGPTTKASTMRWQSEVLGYTGRDVDGVVGPKTRADTARVLAWISAVNTANTVPPTPAPAPPPPPVDDSTPPWYSRVLRNQRPMMRGWDVGRAQQILIDQGHGYATTVDGYFGDATEQSVRSFQTERGLGVDGVIGPNTARALGA